jgi:hypothetical protein
MGGVFLDNRFFLGLLGLLGYSLLLDGTLIAEGGTAVSIFPPSSKPFGFSYAEWSAKWWQWLLAFPGERNPSIDPDGRYCTINQEGPVWFLAGSQGEVGSGLRSCTIPAGKAILFPVLASECSYQEQSGLKTPAELKQCAVKEHVGTVQMTAAIDGEPIDNLNDFRVQSSLFNVTLPAGSLFGGSPEPGPDQAVSDGWFIMLEPLTPGRHTVEFQGSVTGPVTWSSDANYNLEVKAD